MTDRSIDGNETAWQHGWVRRIPRSLWALVLVALVLVAVQQAWLALRSPGEAVRHALRAAAAELQHAPGTLPGETALGTIPSHFRHWPATIDAADFPAGLAVTLHGLDRTSCRDAVAMARRIEGPVVVELEGYRAVEDCRDENDMAWRFMP